MSTQTQQFESLPDRRPRERSETILAAACRVIAQAGARRARLQDVADEAGVSKALIHYYFKSRHELLAEAYAFADRRARHRVFTEISGLDSAAGRLRRLLLLYFLDERELQEDWILWSELSATAVFDAALRPSMEASFATWIAWLEALIVDAVEEGSLPEDLDPKAFAHRLTAIIDGLGSQVVRGLISSENARTVLEASLDREIDDAAAAASRSGRGPRLAPATGYLRLLARLTGQAVAELEPLASSRAESEAVRKVVDLVDRVAGGAAASVRQDDGAKPRRPRSA